MEILSQYFLYFIIYAFLGWCVEVTCQFIELKRFVNRGFLIGPICPIYGYGVLGIIFLIGKDTSDVLGVFLKAILICSILEYFTSYFMEKLFKARWWDYSTKKFNINGRICLETMIPFGILGCLVVYVIHPLIKKLVGAFNPTLIIIISITLFIIYIVDNLISLNVMNKIKNEINKQSVDNTEMMHKKVQEWLDNNSIFYRHIKQAYPKFKVHQRIIDKINQKKNM